MSSILGAPVLAGSGGFGGNLGIDFVAEHTGNIVGIYYFQPAAGGAASATVRLYDTITQAVVASAVSGALTPNTWNLIPFAAPVAITPGHLYTASVFVPGSTIAFTSGGINAHIYNGTDLTGIHISGRATAGGAPAFPTSISGDLFGVDVEFTQTPTCPECPPCPPTEGFFINLAAANFGNIVTGLGQCACDALEVAGRPVCRCCPAVPGSITWDDCGCVCEDGSNGQLAAAVTRIYPSDTFPQPATESGLQSKCGAKLLVAEIKIEVTRCVPTMDAAGTPPACDDLRTAAMDWNSDAAAVRQAVGCCLRSLYDQGRIKNFAIGQTLAKPEQGGCAGSELTVLTAINNCNCLGG